MSLIPDTSPLPHEDPAGFLRAAYTRLNMRDIRLRLDYEDIDTLSETVTRYARLLPLAHGDAKGAQDWMISMLDEFADAEREKLWVRTAWLEAEFELIHALAIEHGIDLHDGQDGAGHG